MMRPTMKISTPTPNAYLDAILHYRFPDVILVIFTRIPRHPHHQARMLVDVEKAFPNLIWGRRKTRATLLLHFFDGYDQDFDLQE